MSILIGTSGWSYPTGRGTWNGVFYPTRRAKGFDELAYYAEHFSTVEVNSTFYRQPDPGMAASWVRRTPPGFGFSIKLFQKFTHPDMYVDRHGTSEWDVSRADLDVFKAGIEPLAAAGRLIALLVQFPPSFHADPNTRLYLEWLVGELADYVVAVELRHKSWSDAGAETRALLDSYGAAWTWIDEPKFQSSVRQDLPEAAADGPTASAEDANAPLAYLRLHGRNAQAWWEHDQAEDRYDYLYRAEELEPVATAARAISASGRKVVAYFNNHFSAKAVANAAILKQQVGDLVPGEYPREMVERYPELRGIVTTSGLPL